MKSKFKSGDIVAARDKLFIIKQGLANSMQQKSWSDVWYEYLAYELHDGRANTDETYVLKEDEMRYAILAPKFKEKIKSNNSLLHETVPWEKDRHLIKVKGSNKPYCIIGIDLPFYLLSELIIRGNDIAIAPSHEIRHSQDLEQLSSHEKALLTGEVKPKVMSTIQQELQLESMNKRFVESMSKHRDKQESVFKTEISRNKLQFHIETYTSELEEKTLESFKRKYLAANTSLLDKVFIKVRELIRGLFDSFKSVFKQQQKNDEALINTEVLQAIYAYVDDFLPCPTDTRDKLAVFVSEYKKINSEDEKGRVINKIGDTVKTVHYELERDKSDIEKVNKIIDSMIEYIRLVNESSKSNVDTKLELEHDYMKKLLEDTRNAKRVAQGDTKSFEDIIKEDGFNIK